MFKKLIDALRQRPLLNEMICEMEQMLAEAVNMYRPIAEVLTGKGQLSSEKHQLIYETDRKINHIQRKIRKQLVEHLIVSPGSDVPISLILMSITKDAERIGDICKNMYEVAEELDTNPNALYKLLHDARKRLQQRLEEKAGLSTEEVLGLFSGEPSRGNSGLTKNVQT